MESVLVCTEGGEILPLAVLRVSVMPSLDCLCGFVRACSRRGANSPGPRSCALLYYPRVIFDSDVLARAPLIQRPTNANLTRLQPSLDAVRTATFRSLPSTSGISNHCEWVRDASELQQQYARARIGPKIACIPSRSLHAD